MTATLFILMGLPGSGKTTLAADIATRTAALTLSPDDWIEALGLDLWDEPLRARVEALQWQVGRTALAAGLDVIVEWGTWGRDERAKLRSEAQALGARVELHVLDLPTDILFDRIHRRNREDPPITRAQVVEWARLVQWPDAAERALYDRVVDGP